MTPEAAQPYVTLICPRCKARLHPRREQIGRKVRCPDCKSVILVEPPKPRQEAPALRDPGEYGIAAQGAAPARHDDVFLVVCPTCRARLFPHVKQVGATIVCPDCDVPIVVPQPPPKQEAAAPWVEAPGEFSVGGAAARPSIETTYLLARAMEDDRPPPPKTPRLWFATGVFDFPFRGDAIGRWVLASLLYVMAAELAVFGFVMVGSYFGGEAAMFGVGLLAIPIAILSIWASAVVAACFLAIIPDTSAGNDELPNWPEADWREWIWSLILFLFLAALAACVGLVAALPVWNSVSPLARNAIVGGVALVVFPFIVLGSIEGESPFLPYSSRIARSLGWAWISWLIVEVITLALFGLVALITYLLARWSLWVAPLVGLPLFAAAMFSYGRLLGRLGWRIGEAEERRALARLKEPQDA